MAKNKPSNVPENTGKKSKLNLIEIFLIAATVFVLGFVGYAVYQAVTDVEEMPEEQQMEATEPEAEDDSALEVPEAPEIDSAEDLDTALETLDETDPDAGSDSEDELEESEEEL